MVEVEMDRHPFRVAFETRDLDGVRKALAPDVALNSPITSRFRFVGRDEVADLIGIVRELLEDLQVVAEFGDGDLHVLAFRARVEGHDLEGADLLRLDEEGRVCEITVFVRPLPGVTALLAALAPRVTGEAGRPRSIAAAGFARTFAALSRLGDRAGARLVSRPGSPR
jgi:hypothetical protein